MKKTLKRFITALIAVSVIACTAFTSFGATNGFKDVQNKSDYWYTPVYWAAHIGITKGFPDGTFRPKSNCTRSDMIILLWRLSGKPAASGTTPFKDVEGKLSRSSDRYKAILWGNKNGIIRGYETGKYKGQFRTEDPVARKDTLIMLYRLAHKPGISGNISFPDVRAMNLSAKSDTYNAILWGTQKGITKGYADGNFQPMTKCMREHIITFVYRFARNIQKRNVDVHSYKAVTHEEPVYKTVHHDAVTEQVWVVDQEAWDEQVDNGHYEIHTICESCGLDTTGMSNDEFNDHIGDHMINGEGSAYYDKNVWVPNITTVHHDATGHNETKVVQAAYDEQVQNGTQTVTDYYKCSGCGATK